MERMMTRRQVALLMAAGAASLVFGGCAKSEEAPQEEAAAVSEPVAQTNEAAAPEEAQPASSSLATGSALVVYYSLPEATSVDNMTQEGENSTVTIGGEVLGNVQYLAQLIAEQTGGQLARIEAVAPYPISDHQQLIAQAQEELDSGFRPEITGAPTQEQIEAADVIFLGYPIWWADLPTPMYTMLESIDLSGKTVIPFTCHGGSGFASTRETLGQLQPGADIQSSDGFSVSRNVVADSAEDVADWLNGLGFEE